MCKLAENSYGTFLSVPQIKSILGIDKEAQSAVVSINATQAEILLRNNNVNNRKMSTRHVQFFVKRIKEGTFYLSESGLTFDHNGVLTNAQHRLEGVRLSGTKGVPMTVTFDVDHFMGMDTGKGRSLVDNAMIFDDFDDRLRSEKGKICLKVSKDMLQYCRGHYCFTKFSQEELVDIANYLADDLIACYDAGLFAKCGKFSSLPVLSALFLAFKNNVPLAVLQHIKDVLRTGVASDDKDKPIIGLRDKLMTLEGAGRVVNSQRFCLTCSCIERVLKGRKSKRLESSTFLFSYINLPHV